jgi:serine/threonine-protein kinase
MEALQGESLAHYLDREKTMPQSMVLALAREAAGGLVAAHHAGIVHRDLKPGNLYLLGPQGAPTGIKIIDFGLSKDLRRIDSGPSSVNLVLGTAQFMAPEQVLADPIDARTDIYAFGVVLFNMLTGSLPFDLKLGPDLFCHQLFSPAPPPSWLLEDVDPRLEQVIVRCLRKHPENRYASMQALLDDLVIISDCPLDGARRISPPVLRREPDLYLPRSAEGRGVAENLARYFGSGIAPILESLQVDQQEFEVVSEPLHTKVSRR